MIEHRTNGTRDIHAYDVIVVGAGVVGCSIAYHLTKAGLKTALLDQGHVGAGASGANFGEVMLYDAELKHSLPMVKASFARYAHLEEELGMTVDYKRCGALRLFSTEEQWKVMGERTKVLAEAGIRYELVSPEQIKEIEPLVDVSSMFGGAYSDSGGKLSPFRLMWAYLHRAIPIR